MVKENHLEGLSQPGNENHGYVPQSSIAVQYTNLVCLPNDGAGTGQ
jgi:hypothetical protein